MSLRKSAMTAFRRGKHFYISDKCRLRNNRTVTVTCVATSRPKRRHWPSQCSFSSNTTSKPNSNSEFEGKNYPNPQQDQNEHGIDNTNPYIVAISKLCRSGRRDAAQNAETLLKRMEDVSVSNDDVDLPNTVLYNQVILLYANDGYGQQAENLLRRMQRNYRSGKNILSKPDLVTYNTCISAWANSKQRGSASRAEKILKEMMSLFKEDTTKNKDIQPDIWSFNTVIAAFSRDAENSHRSSDIINEMYHFSKKYNLTSLKVDSATMSSVLNVLASSKGKQKLGTAARQAEAIIDRMETLYDAGGHDNLKPDAITYSSYINVLSKSGDKDAADRALSLLQRMEERYREKGDYSLKPDIVAYNSVLSTIANSNSHDCGRQAETLLNQMQESYDAGDTSVRPNTISYSTVIQAWKNSAVDDASEKAESILRQMQKRYDDGDDYVYPNTVCFSTVISALAKDGTREAAERAEELLEEMQTMSCMGESIVEPNTVTYTSVMEAWASTSEEDALARAENIIQRMIDLSESGDSQVSPNTITYNTLIKVVEKCPFKNTRNNNKALKVGSILQHMHKSKSTKPNIRTYNAVFQACAATTGNKETKNRALSVVMQVLNEMRSSSNIAPNTYTYPAVLKACANLFTGDLEPLDVAFHSCCLDGMVDLMVLSHVRRVAPKYLQQLTGIPSKLLKLENIPKQWTKKVNKIKKKNGQR